jgi:Autographiviridae endonuclease I
VTTPSTSKPILIEARYRSHLEKKVADQLDEAGVPRGYESQWVHYTVPSREAKYLPDFTINNTNILIEAKGRFGGHMSDSTGERTSEDDPAPRAAS